MKDGSTPASDRFQFNWSADGGSGFDEFRDPVGNSAASIRLCTYDASANTLPLMDAQVAAGGSCGTRPCWKQVGSSFSPKGYAYKDSAGTQDGITAITLKSPPASTKTKIAVKGKGALLPLPAPLSALQLPVTVQLVISDGATGFSCWQATFAVPTRHDATHFGAKGP